jgi:beta-phosphoglucomutase-like phosphatase (HAD superfamily)
VFETGLKTSFLFDLDGTLVDSVYQHVLAWREAKRRRRNEGIPARAGPWAESGPALR